MRRGHLLLSTALIALAVVPAATANKPPWVPERDINLVQPDQPITDQCAFPVLLHVEGPEIDTTFLDKDGNPVRLHGVFPGNTVTLTNLDSGKSITLSGTGLFSARAERDGSVSVMVTGHGPLPPILADPLTGQAGIWYFNGRVSFTVDVNGNPTSVESVGTLVNLCGQLAS